MEEGKIVESKRTLTLSPYKFFLVGLLGFAQGVIFLLPYIMGPFYTPMINLLECTNEQLGSLMSIYGVIMWFTLIPGGWIADKIETRKVVASALVLTGAIGFSMSVITSFAYYFAMWALMSVVHNMLYWSAAIKFVRIVTSTDEQGKAYGYSYGMNGLAMALLGAASVWIFAMAGDDSIAGVKSVIVMYSIMSVLTGVAIWIVYKKVKAADGRLLSEEEKPAFFEMLSVLKLKPTWIFAIICFSLYTLQSLIIAYFTPFFTEVLGMAEATAAGIYVAINFLGVFSPILMGIFADKLGSTIKAIIISLSAVIVVISIMLAINQMIPIWAAILIDVLAVGISGGIYSVQFSAFDEIKLDRKVAGSCVAVASIVGYSSDVFIWTLFGNFLDNYGDAGYNYIFGTLLGIAVLGLLAAVVLAKWAKNDKVVMKSA